MALYNFHRVLIGATILFFLGFGVYAWRQTGTTNIVMSVGSFAISALMVLYLIYFNARLRKSVKQ